jgi:hypothetical protein
MPTPNVVGYVTEFVEDRDADNNPRLRFKLKLKNTLGEERVVWAVPEEPSGLSKFFAAGSES